MLRFTVVTMLGVALALGLSASADERWIIEPGPEAQDAQKLGASEVERAQKLAKEKHLAEATAVLEGVARKWPASVHDCNLALAYLRQKALTRAQLVWDLSALRNGTRPKWCTGEVSTQLSDALHKEGYVPTTIEVVPPDAVVEVSGTGIAMRSMRTVWLRPGPTTLDASARGRLSKAVQVTIAPPVAKVTITLEEPQAPPPAMPDAGVEPVAPADAAPMVMPPAASPPDAAIVPIETPSPSSSLININGKPLGRRTVALVSAVTFWVGAGVFGTLAYVAKNEANKHYVSDPVFANERDAYTALTWTSVGFAGAATIATAIYIYFRSSDDKPIPRPGKFQVTGDPNGFGISYSGTFGGDE